MDLKEILEKHKMWVRGVEGGERANLHDANLRGADLRSVDLRSADLRSAKTDKILYNIYTSFYPMQCPEEGSYIG